MKKQLLLILLTLMPMVVGAQSVEINGLWYNLTQGEKNTAAVTAKPDGKYAGKVIVPASVRYQNITYPVTSIEAGAFAGCQITAVYCQSERVPATSKDAFLGTKLEKAILYVPNNSVKAYQSDKVWGRFGKIETLLELKRGYNENDETM